MFSIFGSRKRKIEKKGAVDRAWNDCLDLIQKLLKEHRWVVDEEDQQEVFCDVCGQSLTRTLEELRR